MSDGPFALHCADCDALFDHDDITSPVYECSRCSERYGRDGSADGDSNRCPHCNIFGARTEDLACPECGVGDVEEGEFHPPPPPTEEQIQAAQAAKRRSAEMMKKVLAKNRKKRERIRLRWAADEGDRAAAFDAIDPDLSADVRRTFVEHQSSEYMLHWRHAEHIARALLSLPVVDLPDPYEAMATRTARWKANGLWRAFEPYDRLLGRMFVDGSHAVGVREPEMARIARALAAASKP